MKVATPVSSGAIDSVGVSAQQLEHLGFDYATWHDLDHDAFLPLAVAASHTSRINLSTLIAVAYARTPMLLAILANDMQVMSHGRFRLGLGTQIKAHITRRFDMPWSKPASRMAEMIQAINAIWTTWETGERLDFHGEFYQNSLMTPAFTPERHHYGRPKIVVAAVGTVMTETVASVADGLLPHGFSNEKFFREVTLPAVERGLAKSGRSRDDFHIDAPGFVVTGATDEALARQREKVRRQISFYGSTPAYRPAFEVHGWGGLGDELHRLSVGDDPGKWDVMASIIPDEVLETFAVVASPQDLPDAILARYGDVVDGVTLMMPGLPDDDVAQVVARLRAADRRAFVRGAA
jgi:probable F420-dependent oxidoreductase